MLKDFKEMAELVKQHPVKKRLVLACAHDEHSLEAVAHACKEGIIEAVLVGREADIKAIAEKEGLDISAAKIYDVDGDVECAKKAVELIREGEGDFLMKGKMQTADLLREVVNKETGLRTGNIMSHFGLFQIPHYHKVCALTDGGMIENPDLEKKVAILNNAVSVMHSLGYENPNVAVICAAEKFNKRAQESVDAVAIKEMYEKGEITGCTVEAPISYDIALHKDVAEFKGFESPVAGEADILLMPGMASGNMLGKAWILNGDGTGMMAGMVVGAKAPIVLVSRAASADEKFYSIVLAAAASTK